MKKIVILGSTGSIGENALKIVEALPGRFEVVGLAANTNAVRLAEQAKQLDVKSVVLGSQAGDDALCELVSRPDVDLVVCAMVGMAALRPVLAAIAAGHDVALATKEVLVSAGELVMRERARQGVALLPIDSEHSAIFQCLQSATNRLPWCVGNAGSAEHQLGNEKIKDAELVFGAPGIALEPTIRRLILTASGGPFANRPDVDFATVTVVDALNHPRWKMGPKVTVDSATMMNKGLEILEARWLFDVPVEKIDALVHPESVVHSLVEFEDATVLSQLGVPDMRLAIQYAMTWPERVGNGTLPRLDLAQLGGLTFRAPDEGRFPCLRLAREAALAGGTMPAVMNAANEVAVGAFLGGRLPFTGIWRVIGRVMAAHTVCACEDLETVVEADAWARRAAEEEIGL